MCSSSVLVYNTYVRISLSCRLYIMISVCSFTFCHSFSVTIFFWCRYSVPLNNCC